MIIITIIINIIIIIIINPELKILNPKPFLIFPSECAVYLGCTFIFLISLLIFPNDSKSC